MSEYEKMIHIGTSGWNYNHWKGVFYPDKISSDEMLSYYITQFNTLEINGTFYRLPSPKTLKHWKNTVPDHFIFSVKASRYITHMKKLNDPAESIKKFFDRVPLLGKKLGPILFQLPPHWHKNTGRLKTFIEALPDEYPYTFEFRDETWFDEDILKLLSEKNAAFCIYELGGKESPIHITSDFIYIRLHGPGEKYQGNYTKKQLESWAVKFKSWVDQGKEIYCYFDNDYEGRAPQNARLLIDLLK